MKTPAFLFALICSVFADTAPSDGCECINQRAQEELISLTELKTELKFLTHKFEEQSAKVKEQETQLRELNKNFEEQSAKVKEQETQLGEQQAAINKLNKTAEDSQVAFSASLADTREVYVGPFNTHTVLIFPHTETNVGNAYNPQTGIFTAPVRGVYHFELHALGPGGTQTGAWVMVNGRKTFMSYAFQTTGHWHVASNSISLVLEVRDQVYVHQETQSKMYDNGNHHSTFSGHLLFTL